MSDSAVLTERRDELLVVTINRPDQRNAINRTVAEGIAAALDELDDDRDLRVGIVTGAGGTFSAGMDLKAFVRGETPYVEGRGFAGIAQRSARKPLIAAVEGYALAGGFEIALSCDLIVAAEGARFGIPEVKRGLVAAAGGLFRLPRRIPQNVAMELALTGEPLDAARAAELGLVSRVTPSGASLDGAVELAGQIAANGPLAALASKEIIVRSRDWSEEEAWDAQSQIVGPVFASADAQEGATAFAERRAPNWKGE